MDLERLKILTGLEDERLLELAAEQAKSRLLGLLNARAKVYELQAFPEIPGPLDYIVLEVAVKRIRRLGSEGLTHEAVEGHSRDFQDAGNDFDEFAADIDNYLSGLNPDHRTGGGIFIW